MLAVGEEFQTSNRADRCSVELYFDADTAMPANRAAPAAARHEGVGVHCDGGMCERLLLPASKLHRSEKLTLEQLALVETLAIGCHAVNRSAATENEDVLIIVRAPSASRFSVCTPRHSSRGRSLS